MIECGACNNTRKVTYEDELVGCPVCEEYIVWGKTDGKQLEQDRKPD